MANPNVASPLMDPPPPYSQMPPTNPGGVAPPVGFQPMAPTAPVTVMSPPGTTTTVYQAAPVTVQPAPTAASVVVVAASKCPSCQAGILTEQFTCCGICLGICFFPLGLICCFLMRETRCSNCRAVYS